MPNDTYEVRISAGTAVIYLDDDGRKHAGAVRRVHVDDQVVEVQGVPGVLRIRDILAVGVYGDEAKWFLDDDGVGEDRIVDPEPNHPEFECPDCGNTSALTVSYKEGEVKSCPQCGYSADE